MNVPERESLKLPASLLELQSKLTSLRQQGNILIQNGDAGYASAPSNIALMKYWGKHSQHRQVPLNSSMSYTLGGFRSFTKVEAATSFSTSPKPDKAQVPHQFFFGDPAVRVPLKPRFQEVINHICQGWADDLAFRIESSNNFPTGCGIASSAAGGAALVGALADLFQLEKHFSREELHIWLSQWARLASGSATRSVCRERQPHFVSWCLEDEATTSTALETDVHPHFMGLGHLVLVVDSKEKATSSSKGHLLVHTSPLFQLRMANLSEGEGKLAQFRTALAKGDFHRLKELTEEDAFSMHAVMLSGQPPATYITSKTADIIRAFQTFRGETGLRAFWTLDAGPNIHLLFLKQDLSLLQQLLQKLGDSQLSEGVNLLINQANEGLLIGKRDFHIWKEKSLLSSSKLTSEDFIKALDNVDTVES